ncbi:maltose alpha-D-glucosyltransferase [Adhaeribacter sp. BT258]|uniref:Maltokinase n=1 Tax=Adhaeribacter terrigena TaxID=2793070 RepID=A0ABS1C0T1_9BACT|nr:maltose alpha-D-glucosyltransferase [Adhaeribacter terrigena]MBK0402992.1 maltose alpha-D-glucosyltransferase [Adhaeribacter terrigena]
MATEQNLTDENLRWYKDAIIYELHIKAFSDSNKDGIGDFEGLLSKLDYVESLGVTAIWLLPFYPSPLRDDGYDIADYYSINPSYGNINQFKKFLKEAHNRGLRVITELVINHSSDQHPWFQRARHAAPGSVERDYYVWSDDPNKYKDVRIIFTDTETSNWTWDPVAKQYYWHRFFSHQPDLNYDNPKVQEEVFKMLDYWLDMGVDGFRLDAVPYLFEREGTNGENLPETHEFLKKLRRHVDEKYPGRLFLAEANMWPEESASYFGNGDECHMNYHFPIMPRMFMSVKMEDRYPLIDILDQTPEIPETCQWAMFLRNHDELTLEMVTDEERDYMYKVYTKDPMARINLGIRHRLAPLLDNNRSKIELMNIMLFSMPGTPVIYYGDEIGMGDNFYLGDRDGVRTPMQWSPDRNAGFSQANPQQLYLPVIIDPEYKYEAVNVENQEKNPNSLLWWMKRVIAMRKRFKAFGRGKIKFLSPENTKVLAFLRTYEEENILVVCNLSRFPQAVELPLEDYENYSPVEVFGQNRFPKITTHPYLVTLAPYGFYWFTLKPDQALQQAADLPEIRFDSLVNMDHRVVQDLEDRVLREYLLKCRWFGGKARIIQRIEVTDFIPVPVKGEETVLLIMEVTYNEGLPELYQLALSFAAGKKEEELRSHCPQSIVATARIDGTSGILYDSVYSENFRHTIFNFMAKRKKLDIGNHSELIFHAERGTVLNPKEGKEYISSKILGAEQSNTSIIYDDEYFFKFYRKLDRAINQDLEITRFLTDQVAFPNVPAYKGSIELQTSGKPGIVLGMMQEMITNQGDAWTYIGESVKRFFERVSAKGRSISRVAPRGTFSQPVAFETIPEELQNLLGGAYIERINLLGTRTAEMHLALASNSVDKEFSPEDYSLHYQRSLYSGLKSLVRSNFDLLRKHMKDLPENVQQEAEEVLQMREAILERFKRIFARKIDTLKIRTHGDFHLGQVLFTGKDFVILDFEGEPARSYSERRLKRSPLRDVAGMIRSFHYAAYNALVQDAYLVKENSEEMEYWAEQWYHYVSGFYMESYLEKMQDKNILPDNTEDFEVLIQTFLLEKAIYELGYELNNRPDWVLIPLRGIKSIMNSEKHN